MKLIRTTILAALITVFLSPSMGLGAPNADELLVKQRKQFQQAEHALKQGKHSNFAEQLKSLESYPLYPYLVYQNLKQKVSHNPEKVSSTQLEQFEHRFPDFPYHSTLRKSWLSELARHKHWDAFVKGYPEDCKDTGLMCQYLYGQYHLTHDANVLEKAKGIWLSGKNLPPECDPLFNALKHSGKITTALVWERIGLAFKANNTDLITYLTKSLPFPDKKIVTLWEKGLKNPTLITQTSWTAEVNKATKVGSNLVSDRGDVKCELLSQVLVRLAKQDADAARDWFEAHHTSAGFTDKQKTDLQKDIAMYLAHQRSPQALTWMSNMSPEAVDRPLQEWRVRLSLLSENYEHVLQEIHQLPELLQQEELWQYWKARALDKLGKNTEAFAIYQALAQTRSYYGLLASQRLKQPFNINHRAVNVTSHDMAAIESKPAIQRFREFLALDRIANARTEWYRALEKMTAEERIAAAKIADQLGMADVALNSLLKSGHKDDMHIRFPLAYRHEVQSHAKEHQLDPAWIYALIRQESAFHDEAVSSVGARGLMQLMPETAQTVAKTHKAPYQDESDLFKAPMNIRLGTAYIKQLTTQMHNNPILTTAAYNAGPTRTKKWLPETAMDPEIWIETIPFRETRDYVKNVLTFTAIYHQRLNAPATQKMALWMGPIHK